MLGKKRKHYKEKAKIYHKKVRQIRKIKKEMFQMTIYVFDMDGTLTPARKPMTDEFAKAFLPWLKANIDTANKNFFTIL